MLLFGRAQGLEAGTGLAGCPLQDRVQDVLGRVPGLRVLPLGLQISERGDAKTSVRGEVAHTGPQGIAECPDLHRSTARP